MIETEFVERLTKVEERSKSNTHQIDDLKPVVAEIHTMSITMMELTGEMKHTSSSLAEIKEEVCALKQEPANKWKRLEDKTIDTVVGIVMGGMAAGLIIMIAQNM